MSFTPLDLRSRSDFVSRRGFVRRWIGIPSLRGRGLTGFTLVEIAISTLLIAIGLVALVAALTSGLLLVESSRNKAQATSDARAVFEEMRRVAVGGLQTLTNTDWTDWASDQGLSTLSNETVTVTFNDPNENPIQATVNVSWIEKSRPKSTSFTALMTWRSG